MYRPTKSIGCNIGHMPRGFRSQQDAPAGTDGPRERILAAAERCIDRYGLRKTTIDDIASEAGLSRPSVYHYFADRDELLIELIVRHGRAMINQAKKSMSRQSGFPDRIITGLLYIADHARRDPLTRHVIEPDGTSLGRRMRTSGTSELLRAELFDPFLDIAFANNELPSALPRADVLLWLGNLMMMVMRGLEDGDGDVKRYRSILHRFVAPAFAGLDAKLNA